MRPLSDKPISSKKIYLSSPTMHGQELKYIEEAYNTNWMSTVGENIFEVEKQMTEITGSRYAVALSTGTSTLHIAVKLAGITRGTKVFCSDLTFIASVNPISYVGGTPIFIDSERDTWNMDPAALEKAFELHPDVRYVMIVNLFGTPGKLDEIRRICEAHDAVIIEDAAESLGSCYRGKRTGTFGRYGVISFNGNKIITGSSGGVLLTDCKEDADKARKLSTQAREDAPWYEHEEIGHNYRMSNVIAGVIRGQIPYLEEHINKKKKIYERYQDAFEGLPVKMNPYDRKCSQPNFWLSCMLIDKDAMCSQSRTEYAATYSAQNGKSCPTEILEKFEKNNIEGRPIWKPMHLQPVYRDAEYICLDESVSEDIFERGLCLPSDIKMTEEQQDSVISLVKSCFE